MYGGVGKHGRGGTGGGRGGKRSLPPPTPPGQLQRAGASTAGAARLSLGSSGISAARRGVGVSSDGGTGGAVQEETFRMVSADALDFAAIIRLTPDLVDEIKRLEAQGGAAKIKFDVNSNNLSGNVIDVGGKEFKFTWSHELGVCDIYEELQNAENGNGVLSECGTAWRKLNVQRILDESLKNHVKMRSEEAERRLKSRKSIVLDPANPSVKNQAKTLATAALEGNMRRMHWKKDQFKNKKFDSISSTIPPKPVFKPSGSLPSTSPQPSPSEHVGIAASLPSFGLANPPKGQTVFSEEHAPLASNGDHVTSEKEMANRSGHGPTPRRPVVSKSISGSQPLDLRSLLISLLLANPKGMSLKALEKAVGETIPNAGKKIESVIKSIATYQAPGRYLLKPGVDSDTSRKPPSQNTSPFIQPERKSYLSDERDKDDAQELEHKTPLTDPVEWDNEKIDIENVDIEKIDIEKNSPEILATVVKTNDGNEERVGSSSESGSDSDSESDSSDSESDSQSRSKSKSQSPAGSSSGSESGDSSSGKEGSDVDVDIMTSDDDRDEPGNKVLTVSRLSPENGKPIYEDDREENVPSRAHEVDSLVVEEAEKIPNNTWMKGSNNRQDSSEIMPIHDQQRQSKPAEKGEDFVGPSAIDKQLFGKDRADLEQLSSVERVPKDKNKRLSDSNLFQERSGSSKRPWASSSGGQSSSSGKTKDDNFPMRSRMISPDKQETRQTKGHSRSISNDVEINEGSFDSRRSSDKYMQQINAIDSDSRQLTQIVGNAIARDKNFDGSEKLRKPSERLNGATKQSEKSFAHPDESGVSTSRAFMSSKDKLNKDIRDVIMDVNEKYSAGGDRQLFSVDQSGSQRDSMDHSAAPLRRELSELELGEFREPVSVDDPKGSNKMSERKASKVNVKGSAGSKRKSPYLSKCDNQPTQLQQRQRVEGPDNDPKMSHKRESSTSLMQSDAKQNGHVGSKAFMDSKPKINGGLRDSSDRSKESSHAENVTSTGQKVDFSSDEDNPFYAKYDKDEPVLRGPIKDYSQYKEYVLEYREKYDCYSSLNARLEKHRNEFLKVGRKLETCEERDKESYRSISEKIMQMYQRCRKKHSRMKKIFLVLHDELKALKQRIRDFAEEYSRN